MNTEQIENIEVNPKHTIGQMSIHSQELIKFLEAKQPNDVVTYAELSEAAKVDVQTSPHVLNTARRNVTKSKGMAFGTIRGIGIKILTNDEIPSEAAGSIVRARRVAKKGIATLNCADMAALSAEAKIKAVTTKTVLGFMAGSGSKKVINLAEQSARSSDTLKIGSITSLFSKP